jgi:hypothetical protein
VGKTEPRFPAPPIGPPTAPLVPGSIFLFVNGAQSPPAND